MVDHCSEDMLDECNELTDSCTDNETSNVNTSSVDDISLSVHESTSTLTADCLTTAVPNTLLPSADSKKNIKRKSTDENCLSTISNYFNQKLSKHSTVAADDDEVFCRMLAVEMRKVSNSSIKRSLKKKLLDTCFSAQEEQEATVPTDVQYVSLVVLPNDNQSTASDTSIANITQNTSALFAMPEP